MAAWRSIGIAGLLLLPLIGLRIIQELNWKIGTDLHQKLLASGINLLIIKTCIHAVHYISIRRSIVDHTLQHLNIQVVFLIYRQMQGEL